MSEVEKPSEQARSGRLQSLDGLRAVAIGLVLFSHAFDTIDESHTLLRSLIQSFSFGLGVQAFLVLSGFLITWLLKREVTGKGRIDLQGFYARRAARIYPVFYSYLIVLAVLSLAGFLAVGGIDLVTAGAFLWNYGHLWRTVHVDDWYVSHFWTLSLQEQFYLLWPLTLVLAGLRRGAWIALSLIVLMPLMRIATYYLFPESRGQVGMMLHTGCDPLMFGCLLALWEGTPRFERVAAHLGHWLVPLAATLLLFVAIPMVEHRIRGFGIVAGHTLNYASICVILLWLIRHPDSLVGRLFNSRVMVHIGVLSYGLYVWQQLLLTEIDAHRLAPFPLNLVLCFAVAELSYRLIEVPIQSWRRRRASAAPERLPAAVVPSALEQRGGGPS